MRDNKRCHICGSSYRIKKNTGLCVSCTRDFAKIRANIRGTIYNSVKYGMKSYIWNFLPYTADQLRHHIESQFEPWMSWENQGTYISKSWNDNDQSTWTWQIDHIIPQSEFLFVSVNDSDFQKCWALNNLRPISAKQNLFKNSKVNYET